MDSVDYVDDVRQLDTALSTEQSVRRNCASGLFWTFKVVSRLSKIPFGSKI